MKIAGNNIYTKCKLLRDLKKQKPNSKQNKNIKKVVLPIYMLQVAGTY